MNRLLLASVFAVTSPCVADELVFCASSGQAIPDGSTSGISIPFVVPEGTTGRVVLEATVEIEIEHPWVGDLVVRMVAPDGSTMVDLITRVGMVPYGFPGPFGCGGDDILATFDDGAAESVEDACAIEVQPVLAGSLRPTETLSMLAGLDPTGTWSLHVSDRQLGDVGQFVAACLRLEVAEDCDGDGVPDDCSCVGDLDGDGVVGGSDLAGLLGGWGTPKAAADLDGNGIVEGADLTLLLGSWGPCS
jgi:subtilisin-like proprotein convertase family protein